MGFGQRRFFSGVRAASCGMRFQAIHAVPTVCRRNAEKA